MAYPSSVVEERRQTMTDLGFHELTSPEDAHEHLDGFTGVLAVNSVCGCATSTLYPGLRSADQLSSVKRLTVFAGVDDEATTAARSHIEGYGPSSPSLAVFRDGEAVAYLSRSSVLSEDPDGFADSVDDLLQDLPNKS